MTSFGNDTYASNAEFWVQIIRRGLDRYRTELTDDALLTAIGEVCGDRILDGGCGEGYMSRILAAHGAIVTGLDTSPAMIAAACEERDRHSLGITYRVASLETIPEDDGTFDAVVCNHVLNDVENPEVALKEIGRVTKERGRLILLMLHPCFYTINSERDNSGSIPVEAYFGTRPVSTILEVAGLSSPEPIRMTVRPLEQYISMIVDSGYVITRIAEPHPTAAQREDTWWKANFVKPLFLLIVAERVVPCKRRTDRPTAPPL